MVAGVLRCSVMPVEAIIKPLTFKLEPSKVKLDSTLAVEESPKVTRPFAVEPLNDIPPPPPPPTAEPLKYKEPPTL